MASRYVFTVDRPPLSIDFEWIPGMSIQQRRRSCISLHNTLYNKGLRTPVLDISSASTKDLGISLSAFNLKTMNYETGEMNTVECVYQGSKKFTSGNRACHLYGNDSLFAKKFEAPVEWGKKNGFIYNGREYAGCGASKFYNWIYIDALVNYNRDKAQQILDECYCVFTDVQLKHISDPVCQAQACAQFVEFVYRYGSIDYVASKVLTFEGYLSMLAEHCGGLSPRALTDEDVTYINSLQRGTARLQLQELDLAQPVQKPVKLSAPYTYGLTAHGYSRDFFDRLATVCDYTQEWDGASHGILLSTVLRHRLSGGGVLL